MDYKLKRSKGTKERKDLRGIRTGWMIIQDYEEQIGFNYRVLTTYHVKKTSRLEDVSKKPILAKDRRRQVGTNKK